jgi:hypothetical protein
MVGKGGLAARIGWVVAASGPPVAVVGVWRNLVVDHPVIAVVLLIIYEILVAAVAFTGEIAGELRKRWRERIVDRVDRALGRWVSRFDRRYREFVLGSLRFIDLKGLATVGYYTPELDEVFVDVSLAFRAPNQVSGGLLAELPAEVTDRHSLGDFLDRPQPVVLAVVGVPGSGKTTLLRHTARQVCRARRGRRRAVPILLYLRDHVAAIVSTSDVALPELLRDILGRYRADEPAGWLERRLRDGDCVVLLDGLDEVARQEDRRGVAAWVERQIRQYPKNDYVITSRPQGYRTASIDGATVLQVRSFTDEQVTRFVRGWYLAVERHSTGAAGEDVELRAEADADDLLTRLNDAPGLYDLTVNPLLLTMIATVHRYRGALPGSRADLYGEICQVMLWRRQEAKKLPIELDGDKKEALLRGLAFTMMQKRVRDLPRADLLAEIGPGLRRMSRDLAAEDFLTDIGSNGLLIERESDLYSFAHQTFQEYLAAAYVRDKGLPSVLADVVGDVWWRETTLLYAARSDADLIVRACLDSTSAAAFSLAFDCAEQSSELAPELRNGLDELLDSAFAPGTDPERRRFMAGVLVTRHLRHLVRTSDGGRVCARPITTGLYWLYQQDIRGRALENVTQIEPGTDESITGVYGGDAVAFAHWVNGITSSEIVYRLPNLAEIEDSAVRRALTTPIAGTPTWSTWLEPDSGHGQPELWTPVGTDHPHRIDAATLARHTNDDMERSTPTLTRLLLLRSIITVRVLDLNRVLDLDLNRVLGRDRDRVLDLALGLDRALDRALDRVLDRDFDFDLDLVRDLNLARARDFARDLARDFARDFARDLDRLRDLARDLARVLDRVRDLARDLDGVLARDLDLVMGSALSHALTRVLRQGTATSTWSVKFSHALVEATGIARATYIVSLDMLADKVHSGRGALLELLGPPDEAALPPWAYQVISNLEKTALPIFTRQQPLTSDTATALRLAALCLAAEADVRDANQLGDTFREIAAGVTLLERRANGQAPPTETIILAVT